MDSYQRISQSGSFDILCCLCGKHVRKLAMLLDVCILLSFIRLAFILASCVGWNFLSAPAPHPQNLNPSRTAPAWVWETLSAPAPDLHSSNSHPPRRPSQPAPAPHFFGLQPAAVRKLLKTHNYRRASFCCNKILRKMHIFLTKVAFMHKHYKRQWFTQAIYLHIMLNISKHYIWREMAIICQQFT